MEKMKRLIITLLLTGILAVTGMKAAEYVTRSAVSPTASARIAAIDPKSLTAAQIAEIQLALKNAGFKTECDGVWGKNTVAAMRLFQTARDLPPTGKLTAPIIAELGINLDDGASAGDDASSNNAISPAAGSSSGASAGHRSR